MCNHIVSQANNHPAYTRNLATWLKKDVKTLESSLDLDIFSISTELDREPLVILRYLCELGYADFEKNSDEEVEFLGLALSGVPVRQVIQWCAVEVNRPQYNQMFESMLLSDFRSSLSFARDHDIWFSQAKEMDDLIWLQDLPIKAVDDAVAAILDRFDAPTPSVVAQQVFGAFADEKQIVFFTPAKNIKSSRKHPYAKKTTYKSSRSKKWKFSKRRKSI